MGNLVLAGSSSGSTTITPSATGTYTITLPAETGTIQTSGAGFTTNGVAYASSTSALTTGSALSFNGTVLNLTGSSGGFRSTVTGGAYYTSLNPDGVYGFNTNVFLYAPLTKSLVFYANDADAMRIDSSGKLLINQTSPNGSSQVQLICPSSGNGILVQIGANGNNGMNFLNAGGAASVGTIVVNSASVAYNTSSDYRLKNTIAPMTNALAKVAQLKPVTYKWIADGSDAEGFIAHELAEVCPQAVTGEKDAIDEDGNPKYQGIDTSFLVATLTSAIQELSTLITAQSATITSLTERITALENK